MSFHFQKNVISQPPRPQIELRIAASQCSRCRRPVWITFGRLRKIHFSPKNLGFARVTFQFSAHEQSARKVLANISAVLGRTFQGIVGPRAVLAGVAKKPPKNRVKRLNATLVAQAAQVASAQPERVRSTLLNARQS